MIDVEKVCELISKCQLQTAFNKDDLEELFESNDQLLCTDVSPTTNCCARTCLYYSCLNLYKRNFKTFNIGHLNVSEI